MELGSAWWRIVRETEIYAVYLSQRPYVLQQQDVDLSKVRSQDLNATYLPTSHLRFPVNKDNALKSGIVKAEDADKIVPYIDITIKGGALYKNRLLMLDIVANNEWNRI